MVSLTELAIGAGMNDEDLAHWEKFFNSTPEQREEMSDEEVLAAAVNVVANKLHSEGIEILKVASELTSKPNIWFKADGVAQYVVVTFARYPNDALPPIDAQSIHEHMIAEGFSGYWVGVSFANEYEVFDPESDEGLALMRGFGLLPKIGAMIPMAEL